MPDQEATHGPSDSDTEDRKTQTAPRLENLCQECSPLPRTQWPGVAGDKVALSRACTAALSVGMAPFVGLPLFWCYEKAQKYSVFILQE
jgi:hypothetical protein